MAKRKLLAHILFAFFLLIPLGTVAQIENQAEGLTISPPLSETTIERGKSTIQKIKVTNPIDKQVKVYVSALDFKAKGETGEPDFLPPTSEKRTFSLASWITFSKSFLAIEPQEVEELEYTINVPEDAEPGGHYAAVFFSTEPPETAKDANQVAISSMVGSLILAKVPGQITEKGLLEEFSSDKGLYLKNGVNIISRISNIGNIHFKPKGEITIKSLFGRTAGQLTFNEQSGNVLPDSTRRFENKWESKNILIGPYTATAEYTYGETEKTLEGKITLWIIPWWLIIAVVILILALAIWLWLRRRKRKKLKPSQNIEQGQKKEKIILR